MVPRQPSVYRTIDTVARGCIVADRAFAHARVDHARLGGSQGDCAYCRSMEKPIGQVAPGDAGIGRAPDTAARGAEIEGVALPGMTRNCYHAAAAVRPDQTP